MTEPKSAKTRYKTTNWSAYNAALKARGSLTIWLDKDMQWYAPANGKRGRQRSVLFEVASAAQSATAAAMPLFCPGCRAVIRDEGWLILHIGPATDGVWIFSCDGIFDLVRGEKVLFLTQVEKHIPADSWASGAFTIAPSMLFHRQAMPCIWSYSARPACSECLKHLGTEPMVSSSPTLVSNVFVLAQPWHTQGTELTDRHRLTIGLFGLNAQTACEKLASSDLAK